MLKEFKEFLEKFNVIPAAVGLVLALAIKPVIDELVAVIMQIVAKLGGADNAREAVTTWELGGITIGDFVNELIGFIVIAFVVFMVVKALNKGGANTAAAATPDQALLSEIRDLLKSGR